MSKIEYEKIVKYINRMNNMIAINTYGIIKACNNEKKALLKL